ALHALPRARFAHGKQLPWLRDGANQVYLWRSGMKFREELLEAIKEEAEKLALRHHAYHNSIELEYQRTLKRVTPAPPKVLFTPSDWKIDRKFDPFYVNKKKSLLHIQSLIRF
ncbi:hypothetical protein, partial [Xanthomonas nasturtii]